MSLDRPVPRATYRLQLHKDFRFADAADLAPYLGALGISHAYLSPILMARPGSTHGYDTVDHTRLNPELGTPDDFRAMAGAFRAHGIGIIADIVPNHMGIGGADNPYWLDVLERGEASPYAGWFDIDWDPAEPSLKGRVLVPFLGAPLEEILTGGQLEVRLDQDGKAALWLPGGHKLPLAPETYTRGDAVAVAHLNSPAGWNDLRALLDRQHWRAARHSVADDDINYRRFFVVSDLAGIRIERDDVFEHVHRLVFDLTDEGLIEGLRVDHIDGLFDPKAYCLKLRQRAPRPIYIVVEKILAAGEALPAAWDVEGTTGYEFAARVNPLLTDPLGETALTRFYRDFTGVTETPAELEDQGKRRVMAHELAAELAALSRRFGPLAGARDITVAAIGRAVAAYIAALPIYRTYVDGHGASADDARMIAGAMAIARASASDLAALGLIEDVVLHSERTADPALATELAQRLQQYSGPVMAKGLEDTALFRFNRLIALNDVGERPDRFSLSIADFHADNLARVQGLPHSMLATSTHDSKRGEDTRARIAALSGHAEAWADAVPEWLTMLRRQGAPEIAPDDAYVVFQTLLGAWAGTADGLAPRLVGALHKSLREARLRSHWTAPDAEYEGAVQRFIEIALDRCKGNAFLDAFLRFEAEMAWHGALNGLIETTLKLTVPGVPDIYQGADLWEQSLVDPDNRRPVDYATRQRLLADTVGEELASLCGHWRDGAIKQRIIARLLGFRRRYPDLFAAGSYEPIDQPGWAETGVCGFWRRHDGLALLVVVRLYPWRKMSPAIDLPGTEPLTDVLTGESVGTPVLTPEWPIGVFTDTTLD